MPEKPPEGGLFVFAPSRVHLGKENKFGVPAGNYDLTKAFDAKSGDLLADYIHHPNLGYRNVLYRAYDDRNGKVIQDDRFAVVEKQGEPTTWTRRQMKFDPVTGAITSTTNFQYGRKPDGYNGWFKVIK